MHWTDPSTLEFIHLVLDRIAGQRILLLLTSRPDGQPVLAGHPNVTRVVLNRLGRAAVEAMTAAIEGSDALPDVVRREILNRTDGVPLFVEELTRALVELAGKSPEGMTSGTTLSVPATLHDSLMSRLDRLPEVKRVAQVAACIGRNFDYRTLAAVGGMDDRELNAALDRLVEAELVFRRGGRPRPPIPSSMRWCATPRPTACCAANSAGSMLASPQRTRASRSGLRPNDRLVRRTRRPRSQGRRSPVAGRRQRDRALCQPGGDRPPGTRAPPDCRRAGAPEQAALELRALAMVGVPRIALHGYAATEVEATYRRTVELAERAGDAAQLFQGLRGLWNCIYDRADLENAHAIAERLCALALDHPAAEAQALAYRALGAACFSLGRLHDAIDAFEKGVEACAGLPAEAGLREHGESPLVIAGAYAGFARTIAGDFDRGQALIETACRRSADFRSAVLRLCPSHRGKHPVPAGCTGGMRSIFRRVVARCRGTSPGLLAGRGRCDGRMGVGAARRRRGGHRPHAPRPPCLADQRRRASHADMECRDRRRPARHRRHR